MCLAEAAVLPACHSPPAGATSGWRSSASSAATAATQLLIHYPKHLTMFIFGTAGFV